MPEPVTIVGFMGGAIAVMGHLARRYFGAAKEFVDISLGLVAFVLALPILGVCAFIIKVCSRGPVLYVQVRVGKDGKVFKMYKLRTMYIDAESASGAVWASDDDPRVVRFCRWMRRSHMDELPQLINVIKGEMSLVGPRPERPDILAELENNYPEISKRLLVKPGITGLAQIRCGYDTTAEAFRNKLQADLEYIEKRKWSLELRIMAATVTRINDKSAR